MNRAFLFRLAFSLTTVALLAIACSEFHGPHRGFDDDDDDDEWEAHRHPKACPGYDPWHHRYPRGYDAGCSSPPRGDVGLKTPDAGTIPTADAGTAADSGTGPGADSGASGDSGSLSDGGPGADTGPSDLGGGSDSGGMSQSCVDSTTCPSGQQCVNRACQPCAHGVCTCQRDNDCPRGEVCDHRMGVCEAAPPACMDLHTEMDCAARADCRPIYAGMHCTNPQGTECHSGEANCTCATYAFAVCATRS